MKKSFGIIALVALVMLAGCKKNEQQNTGTKLTAGIEQHKSNSKTSLNPDNLQITWSEGDQLYVNNGTDAACFTLTSNPGATTGEFATSDTYTFADNNVAVYPYNENITVGNNKVTMTLPAVQTASTSGTFGNGANPMLGVFANPSSIQLTSLCGVLCLQLTGDNVEITDIKIEGGASDKLNGTFEADYTATSPVLAKTGDDGTNKVTLHCPAMLTTTPQKFYVVLPAGTLHGFTMKVYNDTKEVFTKSTANNIAFQANYVESMNELDVNPLAVPLTLEAITDGTIVVKFPKAGMQYTLNGGAKTVINENTTINVSVGDKVQFYGNGTSITSYSYTAINHPSSTAKVKAYGNIMSLVDEDNFPTAKTLTSDNAFNHLFNTSLTDDNTSLTDASGLLLPATTLTQNCYQHLFNRCTALTAAPELPATTMAKECYSYMFFNCTALTVAPELPSTELAEGCYYGMFGNCDHLVAAPELPATTMVSQCYGTMFAGCFGLTTATELPATELAYQCYFMMFNSTALTVAPELPATTLAVQCYYGMFQGCENLTVAPTLPAPTLPDYCYTHMFAGCSSLNSITCLATSGINQGTPYTNTEDWVNGVATSGIFIADPNTTWPTGNNGIPTNWIRKNPNGSDWVDVPTGAVSGLFSVSATKQVYFSKGNLRAYNATANSTSGWVWSFAENQWDYIGSNGSNQYINGSMTISQPGYVDLFCWVGASASYDNYGIMYDNDTQGWGHEATNFGNSTNDALKHDWGHNPITNGGNVADMWRTPTHAEWVYLINSRTTAAGTAPTINGTADARYAKAKLFGTNRGLIIFPDTYVHPDGVAYPTGINAAGNTSWNGNQYSAADWAKMEAAGCVFLPCAGIRVYYTQINDKETRGFYASSTPHPSVTNNAKLLHFLEGSCDPSSSRFRRDAGPVRLVKDAE